MAGTRFYNVFLILCLLCAIQITQPMEEGRAVEDAARGIANLGIYDDNEYYSDSEDEKGYTYQGLPALKIPDEKIGKDCIALVRGIHFSPSKFTRQEISHLRKTNHSDEDIFSSAAYDLADEPLGSMENKESVRAQGIIIRTLIKQLAPEARNCFQEIYSNQYDKFHKHLGNAADKTFRQFNSKKNPQVSTAEDFFHATKYTSGLKFLGSGVKSLDPEYDAQGKPKHPYLGNFFVVLVGTDQIEELDPYFVVHGHASDNITISNHFRKNVLQEREVSFPGFIPGNSVVFSVPIRVPSFKGEYKPWYKEKFGISKRAYNARKKILITGKYYKDEKRDLGVVKQKTIESLLEKVVLPHAAEKLQEHVAQECEARGIKMVYKQLDGTFGKTLPSIINAKDYNQRIKHQKEL